MVESSSRLKIALSPSSSTCTTSAFLRNGIRRSSTANERGHMSCVWSKICHVDHVPFIGAQRRGRIIRGEQPIANVDETAAAAFSERNAERVDGAQQPHPRG